MNLKNSIVGFALVLLTTKLFSQTPIVADIGTVASEEASSIVQSTDGGFALLFNGSINPPINNLTGCTFLRTDCNGNVLFYKTYAPGQANAGYHLTATSDNGFVFLMAVNSNNINSTYITKIDSAGNVKWSKIIPVRSGNMDGLSLDAAGNIYVVANASLTNVTKDEIALLKFSPSGNLLFSNKLEYTSNLRASDISISTSGQIYVLAMANVVSTTYTDIVLIACNAMGAVTNAKTYSTALDDEPAQMLISNKNELVICGRSFFSNSAYDGFVLKCDSNLNYVTSKYYDASTQLGEMLRAIFSDGDNGWIVAGDKGAAGGRDFICANLDSNLNMVWSNYYPIAPQFTNYTYAGCRNINGSITLTGDLRSTANLRQALFLTIDKSGNAPCSTQVLPMTTTSEVPAVLNVSITQSQIVFTPIDNMPAMATINVYSNGICGVNNSCLNFTTSKQGDCPAQCYVITNTSSAAPGSFWYWDFDGGDPAFSLQQIPPVVCFKEKGVYNIKLTVTTNGKSNSVEREINTEEDCAITIPNIFTPNGDNVNDVFFIKNLPDNFLLTVVNRWGNIVFETKDKNKFWDGTNQKGTFVSEGVYFYILQSDTFKENYRGTVSILY
nr:gliding motility-associated C-terminal domain-containing protein [Bacteroidota bacterium]